MQNGRKDSYHQRSLEECWLRASTQFPVLLLTGPRQVGKTTLLEHLREKERHYVTLDDLALRALAREDPDLLLQRFPPPVLIDEVQYAPELFPSIKKLVDQHQKPGAFWLTGSQQFHMMKDITETLAGRVAVINLLGFSRRENDRRPHDLEPFLPTRDLIGERSESGAATNLRSVYQEIWSGSLPAYRVGKIKERDLFYRSYLQTYLERDVRDLVQIGNLESFRRFLKASAARTSAMLNYSDLARDAGVSVNTARQWMSVLVASFQVFLLQPYYTSVTKRLSKTAKLYFLDTGLCAYLTEWSSPETLEAGAMSGAILETYVFTEILKSWWHRMREVTIYYYRNKDGREVDFLISRDGKLFPLEVKKSTRVDRGTRKLFLPLRNLKQDVGQGAVVCMYPQVLPIDDQNLSVPVGIL